MCLLNEIQHLGALPHILFVSIFELGIPMSTQGIGRIGVLTYGKGIFDFMDSFPRFFEQGR